MRLSEKFDSIISDRHNGNISDFRVTVRTLTKAEIHQLLEYMHLVLGYSIAEMLDITKYLNR